MHTAYAKKHFTTKTGSTIHGAAETKTADATPAPDAVKSTALDAQLDVIYARTFGEKKVIDAIANRVPATAYRAAVHVIEDRVAKHEPVQAAEAKPADLDAIYARINGSQPIATDLESIYARLGVDGK